MCHAVYSAREGPVEGVSFPALKNFKDVRGHQQEDNMKIMICYAKS